MQRTSPLISIIVPCYNGKEYIEGCIRTLKNQTFVDFEVLIVNDGSNDGSDVILERMTKDDERFRILHKKNGGVSSARNLGLDKAKGQYITFVDIDDELYSDGLETMLKVINSDSDIVFAGYDSNEDSKKTNPRLTKPLSNKALASELFQPTYFTYIGYPWAKLYKRSIIEHSNIRFDKSISYNEDRLFTLTFLSHAQKGVYTTIPVYNYIQRGAGAMAAINGPNYWKFETDLDAFVEMNEIVRSFNSPELTDLVRQGTISSYRWNKRLNMQYGNNNADTNQRLRKKLMMTLPKSYLLRWKLAEFKDFVYNRLRNFIK